MTWMLLLVSGAVAALGAFRRYEQRRRTSLRLGVVRRIIRAHRKRRELKLSK